MHSGSCASMAAILQLKNDPTDLAKLNSLHLNIEFTATFAVNLTIR